MSFLTIFPRLLPCSQKEVALLVARHTSQFSPPNIATLTPQTPTDSLTSALSGQDAVVSTLGSDAIANQLTLVEAAAKAGIQRFIPSEFGSNTVHPKTGALPVFQPKIQVQDALKKHGVPYTVISTGPFLDWGIMAGFIINVKGKSVRLYDGGERVFSTTTLPSIGKAVVGVLKNLDETKDRAVYVQDTATTLKALVEKGKKATGDSEGWKEEYVAVDDLVKGGWEELKKENPNPDLFVYNFIFASVWGEGYGSHFEKLDNELLGIKGLSEAEVQELVNRYA